MYLAARLVLVRPSLVARSRSTPVTPATRTQRPSQLPDITQGGAQQGDMGRPGQGSTEARGGGHRSPGILHHDHPTSNAMVT